MNVSAVVLALVNVQLALFQKEALILRLTKQPASIAVLAKVHVQQALSKLNEFTSL
jgi:hypothetical protein